MKRILSLALLLCGVAWTKSTAQHTFDDVLYGASYYYEYMPGERLDEDIRLMKEAGLTAVRVGESTWGVFEPQEGVFNLKWMDRVLDKLHEADIKVIIGTPPTLSQHGWRTSIPRY